MTSPADAERGVDANSDYEYWCHRTSIYDISHATKAFYAGWHARDLLFERQRQREAAARAYMQAVDAGEEHGSVCQNSPCGTCETLGESEETAFQALRTLLAQGAQKGEAR